MSLSMLSMVSGWVRLGPLVVFVTLTVVFWRGRWPDRVVPIMGIVAAAGLLLDLHQAVYTSFEAATVLLGIAAVAIGLNRLRIQLK